jgi:hypothetical protein
VLYDGDYDTAIMLIDGGADVNSASGENDTPLHIVCDGLATKDTKEERKRRHDVVRRILEAKGTATIDMYRFYAQSTTALEGAVDATDASLVELLLKYGASANVLANNGHHMLLHAIDDHSDPRILIALVAHGADYNLCTRTGMTALHHLIETVADGARGDDEDPIMTDDEGGIEGDLGDGSDVKGAGVAARAVGATPLERFITTVIKVIEANIARTGATDASGTLRSDPETPARKRSRRN